MDQIPYQKEYDIQLALAHPSKTPAQLKFLEEEILKFPTFEQNSNQTPYISVTHSQHNISSQSQSQQQNQQLSQQSSQQSKILKLNNTTTSIKNTNLNRTSKQYNHQQSLEKNDKNQKKNIIKKQQPQQSQSQQEKEENPQYVAQKISKHLTLKEFQQNEPIKYPGKLLYGIYFIFSGKVSQYQIPQKDEAILPPEEEPETQNNSNINSRSVLPDNPFSSNNNNDSMNSTARREFSFHMKAPSNNASFLVINNNNSNQNNSQNLNRNTLIKNNKNEYGIIDNNSIPLPDSRTFSHSNSLQIEDYQDNRKFKRISISKNFKQVPTHNLTLIKEINAYEILGEKDNIYQEPDDTYLIASTDCIMGYLKTDKCYMVNRIIQTQQDIYLQYLQNCFPKATKEQIINIYSKSYTQPYKLNQKVYQTYDPANQAYINLEGTFTLYKEFPKHDNAFNIQDPTERKLKKQRKLTIQSVKLKQIPQGQLFGEIELAYQNLPRQFLVKCESAKGILLILQKDIFTKIITKKKKLKQHFISSILNKIDHINQKERQLEQDLGQYEDYLTENRSKLKFLSFSKNYLQNHKKPTHCKEYEKIVEKDKKFLSKIQDFICSNKFKPKFENDPELLQLKHQKFESLFQINKQILKKQQEQHELLKLKKQQQFQKDHQDDKPFTLKNKSKEAIDKSNSSISSQKSKKSKQTSTHLHNPNIQNRQSLKKQVNFSSKKNNISEKQQEIENCYYKKNSFSKNVSRESLRPLDSTSNNISSQLPDISTKFNTIQNSQLFETAKTTDIRDYISSNTNTKSEEKRHSPSQRKLSKVFSNIIPNNNINNKTYNSQPTIYNTTINNSKLKEQDEIIERIQTNKFTPLKKRTHIDLKKLYMQKSLHQPPLSNSTNTSLTKMKTILQPPTLHTERTIQQRTLEKTSPQLTESQKQQHVLKSIKSINNPDQHIQFFLPIDLIDQHQQQKKQQKKLQQSQQQSIQNQELSQYKKYKLSRLKNNEGEVINALVNSHKNNQYQSTLKHVIKDDKIKKKIIYKHGVQELEFSMNREGMKKFSEKQINFYKKREESRKLVSKNLFQQAKQVNKMYKKEDDQDEIIEQPDELQQQIQPDSQHLDSKKSLLQTTDHKLSIPRSSHSNNISQQLRHSSSFQQNQKLSPGKLQTQEDNADNYDSSSSYNSSLDNLSQHQLQQQQQFSPKKPYKKSPVKNAPQIEIISPSSNNKLF